MIINSVCIIFLKKFWFQDLCQNDLELLGPILFTIRVVNIFIKLKSHKLSQNHMYSYKIILSSKIEIIEGNQNSFCCVTQKKTNHKARASWKCKQN